LSLDGDRREGAAREAATRGPDLLHGLQSVPSSRTDVVPANRQDLGTVAVGGICADVVDFRGFSSECVPRTASPLALLRMRTGWRGVLRRAYSRVRGRPSPGTAADNARSTDAAKPLLLIAAGELELNQDNPTVARERSSCGRSPGWDTRSRNGPRSTSSTSPGSSVGRCFGDWSGGGSSARSTEMAAPVALSGAPGLGRR
jgi:hypothetical protein